MNRMNRKIVEINRYRGYGHNRYDGFASDTPLLIAAGGNGRADCFVDDDNEAIEAISRWFSGGHTPPNFNKTVLENLYEEDYEKILEWINTTETDDYIISLYGGSARFDYVFSKQGDQIICTCHDEEKLIVTK